jgi:2',3'-cyclic-nucleotide 2'-phosphodiesterase (5'-nucleotidase family)
MSPRGGTWGRGSLALVAFSLLIVSSALGPAGSTEEELATPTASSRTATNVGARRDTLPARNAASDDVAFWLTLLHNNDGESQLIDAGEGLRKFGGVARFATLVEDLRAQATRPGKKYGVLMVSSGDNFLAGPEFNASLEKGVPFYDTIAMDLIGYDASAVGNHEFDFGPDVFADFAEGFTEPLPKFVSANLDVSDEPRMRDLRVNGRLASSFVVKARGRRIGIVGATTPLLASISSPRNVRVIPRVAETVQAQVNKLISMQVNKIILVSHLQSIEEDLALAPMITGVDIMVAGGGDELLAGSGDVLIPGDEELIFGPYPLTAEGGDGVDIPVVTTSGSYKYVGRLMVGFNSAGEIVAIRHKASGPVRVAGGDEPDAVKADPTVRREVVAPVKDAIEELASNEIAESDVALNGIRNDVRTIETNEGNLIADALLDTATALAEEFSAPVPNVALQNGGGIRNDSVIGPGVITELDTFDMVPFPNFVSIVPNVPPAQFKQILENAVSRVDLVDGRFAQVAGFSFTWDPAGTAQIIDENGMITTPGTRIEDVTLDDGTEIVSGGMVVTGAPDVIVATIDFLARGGDQYPFMDAGFTTLGITYQQALERYIVETLGGTVTAEDYPEGGEGRITELA